MSEAEKKLEEDWLLNLLTNGLRDAEMRQGCSNHSFYAQCLVDQIKEDGYLRVEPVQLEALTDEEIKLELDCIQPEGFDWTTTTDAEMIKFRAISQNTNSHNEAKFGQFYRRLK